MKLKETAACYMGSWPLRLVRSTSSSWAVCCSRRNFVARRDFPKAMKSFKPFLGKAEKKTAEILKICELFIDGYTNSERSLCKNVLK